MNIISSKTFKRDLEFCVQRVPSLVQLRPPPAAINVIDLVSYSHDLLIFFLSLTSPTQRKHISNYISQIGERYKIAA